MVSVEGTWTPREHAQKYQRAFSHSPKNIADISDASHQSYWELANLEKIDNFYLLSQGSSLYDFYVNHSTSVTENDVIFLINDFKRDLANNWLVDACKKSSGNMEASSKTMPVIENAFCNGLRINHVMYMRHPLDIDNDENFFWACFDKSVTSRSPSSSYAPSRMKIEISTDLSVLRYLGHGEVPSIKIWGMDFFESDYFSHSPRTLRKSPTEKEKAKGEIMKPDFMKLVKEFPKTKFTLNTFAKFETDSSFKNLVVNKLS